MDRKTQGQSAKGASDFIIVVDSHGVGVRPALSIGACGWWSAIPRGWSASRCRRRALELYGLILIPKIMIVNWYFPNF